MRSVGRVSVKRCVNCRGMGLLTVTLLGEKKISLACGGKVRDTVAGVEESRALVGGQLGVGAESEGLVMAETAVEKKKSKSAKKVPQPQKAQQAAINSPLIMVLNPPTALLINLLIATGHSLVANNIDLVAVRADELLQNAADDGCHAGRDDDGGDVMRQRPLEVLVEVRVEGDVLDEVVDALWEGAGDGVHHFAE